MDDTQQDEAPQAAPDATGSEPQVSDERKALVKRWVETIVGDKRHWKKAFDRMDKWSQIAAEGADEEWVDGDKYVVPIVMRHINQAVATLYAKNPKVSAKPKPKLLYTVWDGDPQSIQAAMQAAEQGDPQAVQLLQEIDEVRKQLILQRRMGRTMEILFDHFLSEQDSGYKEQIKAAVRRAKVNGVAYLKLGFQRQLQTDPEIERQLSDITNKITRIEAMMQAQAAEPLAEGDADIEDLRIQVEDLQSRLDIIVREGPVLSFPRSQSIIPDRRCRHLKTFAGSRHVSEEFELTPEEVLQVYGVDLNTAKWERHFKADEKGDGEAGKADERKAVARLWRVWDKSNQQVFVVCDGYPDFLQAPKEPDVAIDRFWPIFPLVFNEAEDRVFPLSDVGATRHMQREYNNARQGLRDHRIANQPKYVSAKGKIPEADRTRFASAAPHEMFEMEGMTPGEKVDDLLQSVKHAPIDPALYETETTFSDVQRAVGSQEANLGGTSDATATEVSIAENSRMSASADNIDDLDMALTALARAMGQVMLLELDIGTVREIAGPGAVWPELNREQVARELLLEIEAGSSGRPNKAAEMANLDRAMPIVLQLPGVNPAPFVKKYSWLLDINPEDAFVEGLPSITALNAMRGPPGGAGPDDPGAQGPQGADNAPRPPQDEPAGQPAFPSPGAGTAPVGAPAI